MQTTKEALEHARANIAHGTTIAAELKNSAQSDEIRRLADAVHWIGHGAQEIILAFTQQGRVNDLPNK